MINNRQNGRRRGRGGQRMPGNPGRPDNGSRIDNRARGNASQLLEKYRALASDAQRQGDRVNTEYYLQFADHYFRVLNENRPRQEDRRDAFDDEFDGEGDEGMEGEPVRADQYQPRGDEGRQNRSDDRGGQYDRQGQNDRGGGGDRQHRDQPRQDRQPQDERQGAAPAQRDDRPYRDERGDARPRRDDRAPERQGGERPASDRQDRPRHDRQNAQDAERRAPRRAEAVADDASRGNDRPQGDEVLTRPAPGTEAASTVRAADMPVMAPVEGEAPRRRGRPRRVVDEAPAAFEADRLPPSLSVTASAEPDAAPVEVASVAEEGDAPKPRRRRAPRATSAEAGQPG